MSNIILNSPIDTLRRICLNTMKFIENYLNNIFISSNDDVEDVLMKLYSKKGAPMMLFFEISKLLLKINDREKKDKIDENNSLDNNLALTADDIELMRKFMEENNKNEKL